MKTKPLLSLAGMAIMATTSLQAQAIGTLTNEKYNANATGDPNSYSNASSIPVSATDLLEGLSPIATDYSPFNSQFGPLTVLTDGTTSGTTGGANAPSDASDAAFDLNDWYSEYKLPTLNAPLGYTLSNVVVTSGHLDFRTNQNYDILVSSDGINFTSLSDGSSQTLGDSGLGFSYNPTFTNGGAAQTTVAPVGANLGTGIEYIEFVAQSGGANIYREIDVSGTAVAETPEPSTYALMFAGLGILILVARFRRSKS